MKSHPQAFDHCLDGCSMRESCWCGYNTHMTKLGDTDEEADPVSSPKSGALKRVREGVDRQLLKA